MARVAIIGSGFIGRAWAISFARAGHDVALWDQDPDAPRQAIDFAASVAPDLARNDLLGGNDPQQVLARLRPEKTLAAALADADHVQESALERLDVKKALFVDLDRLAPPSAIIASSSSAILPSLFTEQLPHRERCLVIHPINPPYLIPAAEVVPAPWTSPEVVERAREFLVAAGQAPIVMKRELDGFVMNRMQGALLEEAFRLVADGFATTEDIDVGIREGLALRWSFMGPFETIDLNAPAGVRDYVQRYEGIYSNISKQTQRRADWAGPVLGQVERERRSKLPADQLGERQKWRDRRLMALAAHKRRAARDVGP
ncbi:MAG TPA: 3-hydroxyacyl-CoA dehydrogenase [Xanthobacteraceae bacterium]|jgi:3-hydroxyacyl-CoA dehydrogenase